MSSEIENWNVFGPMDQVQLGKLTSCLDAEGAEYKVEVSKDEIDQHQEQSRNQPFRQYPTFSGLANFYYIKIPTKNLLIVKKELESIGFPITPENFIQPEDTDEYLCTQCKFIGHQPGFCPTDGSKLLEFSEWVKFKTETKNNTDGKVIIGILLLGGLAYLLSKAGLF